VVVVVVVVKKCSSSSSSSTVKYDTSSPSAYDEIVGEKRQKL